MGQDSTPNRQPTSVAGGSSAEPTPANNSGKETGWGDKLWMGGTNDGDGHAPVRDCDFHRISKTCIPRMNIGPILTMHCGQAQNARSTMGSFLGLSDQKSRSANKYLQRANQLDDDAKPMTAAGEPTCATEDHSFMGKKAGDPDTYPGWDTFKSITGING
jgi:hypothetical protein